MVNALDTKTEQEWKEQYKSYPSVTPEGFQPFHEARIAPILYEIPLGSKVLDVGCNDGELLKTLIEKRDCDAYGVDVSEVAIEKAREKVGAERVQLYDGNVLPFEDHSFDYVTLTEVLVHLVNPETILKEIRRVLKTDGVLLGSTPHENLERFLWDDKRMHHRYLNEASLRDLIEPYFPMCHVRTLTGAQFAVSLATSFLATKPAEMLFKAGNKRTNDWEVELLNDQKLRVYFGYTQLAGTIYYRMLGFADKMDKKGLIQAAYEHAPYTQIDEKARHWQENMRNKIVLGQLENILKVAHVSIWQIVMTRGALAFLRCAKDLMDGMWYKATGEKKYIVTELDDNLFDVPGYNIASGPYQPNTEMEWIALEQIKLSDALVCSTQFLADKVRSLFPEKPIYVVPNSLDFDIWDNLKQNELLEPKKDGIIRIGYTGCSNHKGDLELIKEPLCAILNEFKGQVEFFMTPQPFDGGVFVAWPGIENMGVVKKWVPIDEYPQFVSQWGMDIGIAPLRDNDFNRAKSNLRWLEYSALKIPTVASKVYPFKNSIRHGEDGLICNSAQQWYGALKSLIVDQRRRTEIGQKAYERVKQDFNMDKTAEKYASILQTIKHGQGRS